MPNRVLLPKIRKFSLVGLRPIFESDIHMNIGDGPNVVLGGNGLGKTTIMQAVIYCLTGGSSTIEDEEKSLKWNHKYFKDRIDQSAIKSSFVEVSFDFKSELYSVRRGFSSDRITAFRCDKSDWVESEDEAHIAFLKAITVDGNYQSQDDFAFIVHRLLYLPETRRLLAWDQDAQLRALMLLNQDIMSESVFRQRRKDIKNMDSDKRHIHVAIGSLQDQIGSNGKLILSTAASSSPQPETNELSVLLRRQVKKRITLEAKTAEFAKYLSDISAEVERLGDAIENVEASLVLQLLHDNETINDLALIKLTSRGICPACGTKHKALQEVALSYQQNHQCILCGSENPQVETAKLSTLQSQIHDKIMAQKSLERKYLDVNTQLNLAKREENRLELELSSLWYASSDVEQIERKEAVKMGEDPLIQLEKLQKQELTLDRRIQKLSSELERDYTNYVLKLGARLESLRSSYQHYATKFLGTLCTLSEISVGKFIKFEQYIPSFNGKSRPKPDSCSEAQRFFLDIAFRMALIDYACSASGQSTTFICETPETALDFSYINNVVSMFQAFTDREHSLMVSSNIQHDSIAGELVKEAKKNKIKPNIINLLEIGRLSDVQKNAKPVLAEIARQIIGES
jgi:hypothetical protein